MLTAADVRFHSHSDLHADSRAPRTARVQLCRARLAAWLERRRRAPRSRVYALTGATGPGSMRAADARRRVRPTRNRDRDFESVTRTRLLYPRRDSHAV